MSKGINFYPRHPGLGSRLALLLALLLLLAPAPAPAADAPTELERVARQLQETYNQTGSFRAQFRQLTTMPMGGRQREGAGTVIFRKPHQMRWEYDFPDHQVLVSDGRQVRLYFAASRQLMLRDVADYLESDVTYAFFSGTGDLLRDFSVEEVPAAEARPGRGHLLRLVPRELHPQVEYLDLEADRDSFLIRRLEIVDHFGSVTTLTFSRIELDPELPPDFYRFTPPDGTEILGQ
ncbi:outer membrane lipoprotein carrier protein LolA [Desulfurivibrio sp. D14AmB]|uniref:LolA family protein n=1 Tax=Desulfurivibrio sp. D14AmB TaxID=3374370 RepID=UPI00376EB234